MGLLAKAMAALFGVAFSFFGRYFVADKAARLAAWTVSSIAMVALIGSAFSCVAGPCATNIANMTAPHPALAMGLGIAWNQVTLTAASCYMTVWLGCQLYVLKRKAIRTIVG
jgi:hypothetical protein